MEITIFQLKVQDENVYQLEIDGSMCEPITFDMLLAEIASFFGENTTMPKVILENDGFPGWGTTYPKVILDIVNAPVGNTNR